MVGLEIRGLSVAEPGALLGITPGCECFATERIETTGSDVMHSYRLQVVSVGS